MIGHVIVFIVVITVVYAVIPEKTEMPVEATRRDYFNQSFRNVVIVLLLTAFAFFVFGFILAVEEGIKDVVKSTIDYAKK